MTVSEEFPKPSTRREALVLVALTLIATSAFLVVMALVSWFRSWQLELARRLSVQAESELHTSRPDPAIDDFRSALDFDHDNFSYRLHLAEALTAEARLDEAESYLVSLWEEKPQDGRVNIQLARLAAARGQANQAQRYYHNAIYGLWESDPDQNRRAARVELIEVLIKQNERTQAQAEMIAMEAGLPSDPELHAQVAALFMEIEDYQNAFAEFRQAWRLGRKAADYAAGAGQAAFRMGHYRTAERYLELALNQHANQSLHTMLETSQRIISFSPYLRNLSSRERARRVAKALQTAGARLEGCERADGEASALAQLPSGKALVAEWPQFRKQIGRRTLRMNPDLQDRAMDFVFRLEEETSQACGVPKSLDEALLLMAGHRGGADE